MDATKKDATKDGMKDEAKGAAPIFVFSGGPDAAPHCGDKRCAAGGCRDQAGRRRYSEVEVKGRDLSDLDLSDAFLSGLDFGDADLRHARLVDADLSDSDLRAVKNLLPEQLGGANLHGAYLPQGMEDFEAVARVQDLSQNAGKLLVTLLAACAFMLLTIARLTDPQILTDSATAKLPVVDADISVKLFFVFGPVVILGLYFAFHLYLQRLWETLAGLPAIFPDGVTLDRKTYPWLVNDLVRLHSRFLNRRCMRFPLMYFQEKLWGFVAYWLPPLMLLPFWARYLCCRDWWVTGVHLAALAVAAWSAVLFSYLARITLERDRPRIRQWQNHWVQHNGRTLAAWALAAGAVFTGLSAAAFYGLPPEAGASGRSLLLTRLAQAVPWALDLCHTPAFARFEDMGQAGGSAASGPMEAGAVSLAGARLRDADLRYVRAQGAALPGADLRRANLQFGDLRDTDLSDANLEGAHLEQARLDYTSHKNARNWFLAYYDPGQCQRLGLAADQNARMDRRLHGGRTDLSGYNLSGAPLRRASLRDADLQRACLQYTDLTDADLQMADLTGGSLRDATLAGAHLYRAILDDVDVQGAHFEKAILADDTGATSGSLLHSRNWLLAHYNAQQMTDLGLPTDHDERLTARDFSGYQLENLDLHGSRFVGLRFVKATFYQANLSRSDLRAATFQNAVFYGADLSGATLSGADLTGANLQSARLEGADLTDAVLTGAALTGAEYDPNTKWPTPDFAAHHPEMALKPVSPAGVGAATRWPRLSIIQDPQ